MWIQIDRTVIDDAVVALGKHHEKVLADILAAAMDQVKDGLDHAYRSAAMENCGDEGELEFDDDAVVSRGDDAGAYVMAWKWISNEDAGIENALSK